MKETTFFGRKGAYLEFFRKLRIQNKQIHEGFTNEFTKPDGEEMIYAEIKYAPYSPEEEEASRAAFESKFEAALFEELMIYGDMEYDEYTMSDGYRADVQAEQWDWLKNEIQ